MLKGRASCGWVGRLDLTLGFVTFGVHSWVVSHAVAGFGVTQLILDHLILLQYLLRADFACNLRESWAEVVWIWHAWVRHQSGSIVVINCLLCWLLSNTVIQNYHKYRCDSAISWIQSISHIFLLDGCLNNTTFFLYFSHNIMNTVVQSLLLLELLLTSGWCKARYYSLVCNHFDMSVISWNNWTNIGWSFGSSRMILPSCRFVLDWDMLGIFIWSKTWEATAINRWEEITVIFFREVLTASNTCLLYLKAKSTASLVIGLRLCLITLISLSAIGSSHARDAFILERESRWRLSFERFSAEVYFISEFFLKVFISHSNEYVIISGLWLHSKLLLTLSVTSSVKSTSIQWEILSFSVRTSWNVLPLWIGRKCSAIDSHLSHLFQKSLLFKVHLLTTDTKAHTTSACVGILRLSSWSSVFLLVLRRSFLIVARLL